MKTRSTYWQLLPYLWPHRKVLALGTTCILGYVIITLLLPQLAGRVAVSVGAGNVAAIAHLIAMSALAFLVRGVFQAGQDIWMADAALKAAFDLRSRTYAHLHRLSLDYFETAQTGDLAYRLTEDVDRISEVVNKLSHQLLPCLLQLVAIPIYMLYLNWQLTLATVILAPLIAGLVGWFGDRLLEVSRRAQMQVSNLSALLTEVLGGVRLVQAFAAQDYEVRRFSQEAERNRQARYRAEALKAIQVPIVGFLEAISILFLFLLGGWQISQGNLTGGGLCQLSNRGGLVDPTH
ncbi:ABC transporter ATP-binding protein [Neosynechococcus sphagnicola]|uniref:ABC transporter ATP-binding protein n=1 Tax=Neosynechococcus sphagnicola TaxID=1501145 RepID=UPI000AE47B52